MRAWLRMSFLLSPRLYDGVFSGKPSGIMNGSPAPTSSFRTARSAGGISSYSISYEIPARARFAHLAGMTRPFTVIPAKAGISGCSTRMEIPAFAGMTGSSIRCAH